MRLLGYLYGKRFGLKNTLSQSEVADGEGAGQRGATNPPVDASITYTGRNRAVSETGKGVMLNVRLSFLLMLCECIYSTVSKPLMLECADVMFNPLTQNDL
jgi:hypothetical protein